MRTRNHPRPRQAGFSMVEMLMTAFVLAIGLLGLAMLQAMSLRASRGSRSMATAVQVAEGIMDSIEMEGRLSWLNATTSPYTGPSLANLPTLMYVTIPAGQPLTQHYNLMGDTPNPTSTDPAQSNPFFTATITQVPDPAAVAGGLSDFTVVVSFADTVGATQAAVTRKVTLIRRIVHG